MRFHVNQNLFAVHFGYNKDLPRTYGFFSMPMMFNNVEPDDINFIKLTVTEHHKVPKVYDPEKKPECDGYLLKDETGRVFANQYPLASYGQISDEGNRRFGVHITEKGMLDKLQAENQKAIFEGHLLSDVLERIQRGIKDLKDTPEDNAFYQRCKDKHDNLIKLYDRIVKEFGEKYPDYRLDMAWKPLMKTDLLWPDVSIYKRVPVLEAEKMTKEDIVKDFNSDGRFEVEFIEGSLLVIEKSEGSYYIDGKTTDVKTINVLYAEKSGEVAEDGKEIFYVHQTEYFPRDWVETAVECLMKRLSTRPSKAAGAGMSLEAIAAKDKDPEGINQVRT